MEYNHREIEKKWQKKWADEKTFKAENNSAKPKYYVLDMFPYPSGAGLHVGHPLGYIASDVIARYKRAKGFNVLHPMGYDSFGLPAEQYAIQTGQHPALTTEQNIKRYREQLDKIGFSFDWEREVRTSDPSYYKWTQWIFIELFNSWYNPRTDKAEKLETLISIFEKEGFKGNDHDILTGEIEKDLHAFSADEWKQFDEKKKSDVLMNFRLAYLGEAYVNWCPAMGTVLANDEVKDGVSERGGHPVERKLMKQWSMRITAYAQRLLDGLEEIEWPDSLKEAQRNWIGKSEGSSIKFKIADADGEIEVFTTRPDTIFGVSFVTLAPEHQLVEKITTADRKAAIDTYVTFAKNRSERERMADVKKITGEFTGAYAVHPFNGKKVPIWIGDYVLAGYGTGAVMAVPGHDTRDYAFAKHFGLEIIEVVEGGDLSKEAYDAKEGKMVNSGFLNGLDVKDAIKKAIAEIEIKEIGKGKTNFRLRDAVFGRQRYWGEPIPIYYKEGIPHAVDFNDLPVTLPEVDKYLPTAEGEPPLARAGNWSYKPLSRPLPSGERSEKIAQYMTANPLAWKILKERGRENRKNPTEAENILWQELRGDKLGFNFRRQHSIGEFIVDFVCLEKKLVVEVDGGYHDSKEQVSLDEVREYELLLRGFHTIRFTNEEVIKHTESTIEKIKHSLSHTPQVLPIGEDLGGANTPSYPLETTTMPGWAGSSWYFLRYMDAKNEKEFVSKEAADYWENVDLYMGGAEHATGHLLYVRFWTKFLKDMGYIHVDEPAKKLINQGMIQGVINRVYRLERLIFSSGEDKIDLNELAKAKGVTLPSIFISKDIYQQINNKNENYDDYQLAKKRIKELEDQINERIIQPLYDNQNKLTSRLTFTDSVLEIEVPWDCVENGILDKDKIKNWRDDFSSAFFLDNGKFICREPEIGKMSKRWHNVVNPDDLCDRYGADAFRLYEMFLGPLTDSKPWDTQGIEGVYRFLRKMWRLFYNENGKAFTNGEPTKAELKALHKCIKRVTEDLERYSFNTVVSTFMICVNELSDLKCSKQAILNDFVILLAPYAPHVAEELWSQLGNTGSVVYAPWPQLNEAYLIEDSFAYPVSFNGKTRFNIELSTSLSPADVEKEVLASELTEKYLEGKTPKKVIVVPKRIVNIVV